MSSTPKLKDRRTSRRLATSILAVAKTSHGCRHKLEISDLSTGGCAVVSADHPLTAGLVYGLKIQGLETLGSTAMWTAGLASGLAFERALYPAVADHLAALHPVELSKDD